MLYLKHKSALRSRSPSWGAWIEIFIHICVSIAFLVAPPRGERGLKSFMAVLYVVSDIVAPPRGERGLKFRCNTGIFHNVPGRSPSWGAWIEILTAMINDATNGGRSPSWGAWIEIVTTCDIIYRERSLPLVGSVD